MKTLMPRAPRSVGDVIFKQWTDDPEMGTGIEILEAAPHILIAPEFYADILRGDMHWADTEHTDDGVLLHLRDDYGHRYVYRITGRCWDVSGLTNCVEAKWPD